MVLFLQLSLSSCVVSEADTSSTSACITLTDSCAGAVHLAKSISSASEVVYSPTISYNGNTPQANSWSVLSERDLFQL